MIVRLNENADPQRSLNAETSISFHSGEEETSSNIRGSSCFKNNFISSPWNALHDSKFLFFFCTAIIKTTTIRNICVLGSNHIFDVDQTDQINIFLTSKYSFIYPYIYTNNWIRKTFDIFIKKFPTLKNSFANLNDSSLYRELRNFEDLIQQREIDCKLWFHQQFNSIFLGLSEIFIL